MRAYGRFLVAGLAAMAALIMPLPTSQAATESAGFVTMIGNGDYIGGNSARLWRSGSSAVQVSGSVDQIVSVNVSGGASGEYYALEFAAPPGERLQPGTYVDAQRASFRTAGHPGIDIFGDGRGCNETTGRFTVLDAPADLSRLWLVYEEHCEGGEPAVFGEVRIGEPADSPDLLVAADRISWPTEYMHRDGRVVPVNLFATSDKPVAVSAASISDGDADFSVAGSTCASVLEPGQSCTVYVGFRPAAPGHRTGALTIGRHVVGLEGDTVPGRTSWTLESQPGDRFGGGTWNLEPTTTAFFASGDEHHVSLRAVPRGSGSQWSADFQAGPGQVLLPGTTVTPVSLYTSSDQQTPSMLVGSWGSCSTVSGHFTVEQASYQEGALRSFQVSFEQHCNGAGAALTGTIAWHANAGDRTAPVGVTDLRAEPSRGSALLSWRDPADADWAETVVRRSTGAVPPADVTSGVGVYHGRHGTAVATGLTAGSDSSFAVFPVDANGNVGPRTTLTLRGSAVGVTAPSTVTAGRRVTLAGRLTDVRSGAALAGRAVQLESRHSGGAWVSVHTTTTDALGKYVLTDSPTASTSYRVIYRGSTDHLGVASRVVPVGVSARVSLSANRTSGGRHALFTLSSTVFPGMPGKNVILQRHRADGWHDVRTKPLSAASTATFQVQPDRRGTYTYRVRRPADADHVAGVSRSVTLYVS